MSTNIYQRYGKASFDTLAASLLLILSLPLLTIVATLIYHKLGRPIFYIQKRPGLHGAGFSLVKFRSLTNEVNASGELLPDRDRLTPFGKFLRETSLDELPELVNVLKGEMSLVGPRPLLFKYIPRYTPEQMRRHDVKPGITGLAQVGGRNDLSWEKKFELDVRYVDTVTFSLDIHILLLTCGIVLSRKGVSKRGYFSSPEFGKPDTSGKTKSDS
jgi:sugar transferase EpsL